MIKNWLLAGLIVLIGLSLGLLFFYTGCAKVTSTTTTTTTGSSTSATSSTSSTASSTSSTSTTTTTTTTTTLAPFARCRGGSNQDNGYDVQQTSDNGFILASYSDSNTGDVSGNHGGEDFWIVKLTTTGFIDWQNSLGGSAQDRAYRVRQTSDGGYIAVGFTASSSEGDVGENHGSNDVWLVKLNSSGTLEWQKVLGGSQNDKGYALRQTGDGGYIVAGVSASSNEGDTLGSHGHGGEDVWVIKLDSLGNITWQKLLGGSAGDAAYAIEQTSDGGYVIVGPSSSNNGDVSGNNGSIDYWVVKINSSGSIESQDCFGGSNNDVPTDVKQTSDGGYIVTGYTYSSDGDVTSNQGTSDYWIIKLSSGLVLEWEESYGGSSEDWAQAIQPFGSGYIVAGFSYSNDGDVSGNNGMYDYWIIKISSTGLLTEQNCYGGSGAELAYSLYPTSDGGYVVNGSTSSSSNDGDVSGFKGGTYDVWIIKR